MRRKMISAKLTALAVTTIFASSITIKPISVYGYSLDTTVTNGSTITQNIVNGYNVIGGVKNYTQTGNKVIFEMTTGEKIRVSILENDVFRIYMDPEGKFQEEPTPNAKDHITKIIDKQESEYSNLQPTVENGDIIKVSIHLLFFATRMRNC